jgi:DNA-binding NarL/FixJ family response regulator
MAKIPIAIFDRSQSFLHLLVYVLQQRDAAEVDVIAAANDLATLIGSATVAPAVVLVGLSVPNLVDPTMIRQLRERWPHVAVIALSWLDGEEYITEALAAGANIVISKTQLDTALLPAIRQVAANSYALRRAEEYDGRQSA